LKCLLEFFSTHGVDLGRVEVDVQRVLKMARQTHKGKNEREGRERERRWRGRREGEGEKRRGGRGRR
jgi:hypothetical protein